MSKRPDPPRWSAAWIRLVTPPEEREQLQAELLELFVEHHLRGSAGSAARWYRQQARRYTAYLVARRLRALVHLRPVGPVGPRDLARALRRLVRAPLFAVAIILTVSIGIGGTTAAFSIVNAVLLEPLPYVEPEQLYRVHTSRSDGSEWGFSMADFVGLTEQQTSFSEIAIYDPSTRTLQTTDSSYRVAVQAVTPGYFEMLGLAPALGRTFTPEEAGSEAPRVAVVSHGFWEWFLAARRDLSGAEIHVGGTRMPVVGVLPADVGPLEDDRDIFYNIRVGPPPRKGPFIYNALVRLAPGVGRESAAAELRAINDRIFPLWQDSWPDDSSTWALQPLRAFVIGDVDRALLPLLAAVGLLLLIASTNAANLLLARGLQRRGELGVRAALGASRSRLLASATSEGALLACITAVIGLAIARGLVVLAQTYGAEYVPRLGEISFGGPVARFWLLTSLGSGLVFVLVPSLHLVRSDSLGEAAMASARTGPSRRLRTARRLLVAGQFAIAMPLLIGAGLLIGSLSRLGRVDPGFDPGSLLTARVSLAGEAYSDDEAVAGAWETAIGRLRALPEVVAAGFSTGLPPDRPSFGNNFVLEDVPLSPDEAQPSVPWVVADRTYFETLRIPLIEGRLFEPTDADARVIVVDLAWATRFFPGESAVGRRLRHGGCTIEGCAWWTVIGVVGQVAYGGLDGAAAGIMYMDAQIANTSTAYISVRTAGSPVTLVEPLRRIMRDIDRSAPVTGVATGRELLGDSIREPRYLTLLVAGFAAIALALSVVGVYGVMAYFVQDHRRDIGIRLAVGGDPRRVARHVIASGMRFVGVGICIGLLGALATTRYMASLLYGVRATEPSIFVGVAIGASVLAALACLIPAHRAATTDPTVTLRNG